MMTTWTLAADDAADDRSAQTALRGSTVRMQRFSGVLGEPAYVRCGDTLLTTPQRLWLHHTMEQIAAALTTACGRTVSLAVGEMQKCAPKADTAPAAPGLCVRLRTITSDTRVEIELDGRACRALADALLVQVGGSRGSGPVANEERGVVEFLVLHVLDQLDTDEGPLAGVIFEQIVAPGEMRTGLPCGEIILQLAVGGLGGTIGLRVPWNKLNCDLDPPRADADSLPADRSMTLSVALPPIRLLLDEFAALRPGDLLLPGAATIESYAAACEVVTDRGWSIAAARFVAHRAGGVTIAIDDVRPRVAAVSVSEKHLNIVPTLGSRVVTMSTVARWSAETIVDLPIDAESPIRLLIAGSEIGTCEPVMLEDELALRILELRGAPNEPAVARGE